jgi:hypothetical protein
MSRTGQELRVVVPVPFEHAVPYACKANGTAGVSHGISSLRPMLAGLPLSEEGESEREREVIVEQHRTASTMSQQG